MFSDRRDAGKKLAKRLAHYRDENAVVLALPRGGVVTGYEVARALSLPLDIIAVRKIGHPHAPEYAVGAVVESGARLMNEEEAKSLDPAWLKKETKREQAEAKRRSRTYRAGRGALPLKGKTAILVDDGIATGLTMRLAVRTAKAGMPQKIVVAVPVSAPDAVRALRSEGADEIVVLDPPEEFGGAVGAHYARFDQVEDDEVIRLLQAAVPAAPAAGGGEGEVRVRVDGIELEGTLTTPAGATGLVVFAHGSGSSRFSPRNRFVADELHKALIGTLLIDLLTKKEDEVYETRFNIDLLTERLGKVVRWVAAQRETKDFSIGLFGASTGAAAALRAAAAQGTRIAAVVSRGGRPDLAMDVLPSVTSPTLLIVGGNDFGVIELNERALAALRCEKKLEIVPEATHLFEEKGALEQVAALAVEWFARHFAVAKSATARV